jgi:preprotein translocase subunit SecA
MLSKMLMSKHGVKHEVLNAKQHEREAHIVENAGQLGR